MILVSMAALLVWMLWNHLGCLGFSFTSLRIRSNPFHVPLKSRFVATTASTTVDDTDDFSALESIATKIQESGVSWITGSAPMKTTLFVKGNQHLEFPGASQGEIKSLCDKTEVARFGRGNETLTDLSERSGRTIATENFSLNWAPDRALLQAIQRTMVPGVSEDEIVRAQLYRVNMYGPGDVFQVREDTPQFGTGHFGSLVYSLPTDFEGGNFVLRNPQGHESVFDWSTSARNASLPLATTNYIAFASDLDHRIEPVTSGYRVTVSYHLFREPVRLEYHDEPRIVEDEHKDIVTALRALKNSTSPVDRPVVFTLQHKYSAEFSHNAVLKGGDAALFRVLEEAGMNPKLYYFYPRWTLVWGLGDYHDKHRYRVDFDAIPIPKIRGRRRRRYKYFDEDDDHAQCCFLLGPNETKQFCAGKQKDGSYPLFFTSRPQVYNSERAGHDYEERTTYGRACIVTAW